ncbi:uncharacterized protein LOC131425367 [Malaya genurostris]|uniref:uncharacterized protein LOC131425367 n=1 Tax=Malaya genurostris TaxID=325434 RepID=UPI0026F3C37F|nr:uncharacterized protein LOC131425367 [Malaya genurostris]
MNDSINLTSTSDEIITSWYQQIDRPNKYMQSTHTRIDRASPEVVVVDNELNEVQFVSGMTAIVDLTNLSDGVGNTSYCHHRSRNRKYNRTRRRLTGKTSNEPSDVEFVCNNDITVDLTGLTDDTETMVRNRIDNGAMKEEIESINHSFLDIKVDPTDVELVDEMNVAVDLTVHNNGNATTCLSHDQKVEDNYSSTVKINHEPTDVESVCEKDATIDLTDLTDDIEFDENVNDSILVSTNEMKRFPYGHDEKVQKGRVNSSNNYRVGIFCPRPFRSRLMNRIMAVMDRIPVSEPYPQYKRNGYSLDTMWFLAANEFSSSWMTATIERISKESYWRRIPLLVEPWNNNFVVKNVLELILPYIKYPGNGKGMVIQRLRKANQAYGSNRWNLMGCKAENLKIRILLAVNEKTMLLLKKTQFYVFYGFSQYRCRVLKATTR